MTLHNLAVSLYIYVVKNKKGTTVRSSGAVFRAVFFDSFVIEVSLHTGSVSVMESVFM